MSNKQEKVLRFSLARRFEHWLNFVSFTVLALTGLAQKFVDTAYSNFIMRLFGGVEFARIMHRASAILLALLTVYHVGGAIYGWIVERKPLSMLPGKEDIVTAWKSLRYNLGMDKEKPKQGFYTFEEKFEYWALIWGTLLMGVTGFMLWNPVFVAKYFPGSWIPVAKAAHGNEALLAVLAVLLWHMYHVFIKHFNKSMYTGYMSREEMEHYHALVLEEEPYRPPSREDAKFKRRKMLFTLVYGIISVGLVIGLYWFMTFEVTALSTPGEIADLAKIEPYSPLEPTPYPTSTLREFSKDYGTTWDNGIGAIFEDNCGGCHSSIVKSSGLDLSTYAGALSGGKAGPAVQPGAPGVSLVVIWPSKGDHPGEFSEEELAAIWAWIQSGAPEE